jgi:hypothetical protein
MGILRTRMEHDLVVRGRSEHTRRAYVRVVADLARYYGRSPDRLTENEVQQYVRYLIEERQLAWASGRQAAWVSFLGIGNFLVAEQCYLCGRPFLFPMCSVCTSGAPAFTATRRRY